MLCPGHQEIPILRKSTDIGSKFNILHLPEEGELIHKVLSTVRKFAKSICQRYNLLLSSCITIQIPSRFTNLIPEGVRAPLVIPIPDDPAFGKGVGNSSKHCTTHRDLLYRPRGPSTRHTCASFSRMYYPHHRQRRKAAK